MNRVTLIGRVARELEIYITKDGTKIIKSALALTIKPDKTLFINFTAFNGTASLLEKYVHKGDRLGIDGSLVPNSYTTKTGLKVNEICINIQSVELLEHRTDTSPDNNAENKDVENQLEDLPF